MSYFYKFPAIRGIQAGNDFFVCMIPLGLLKNIFMDLDNDALPEYRAQRKLNEARVPIMKNYIINNRNQYVFSALAASIDGIMKFTSVSDDIGFLEIDMKSKMLINDGQHRKAAILAALEEDESLENETIPVVLFYDKGLSRSQQMFTDLNKHAVTTSKSLNALYDSRDRSSILTKEMVKKIPFLNKYTDKERDNLGKFSSMLFTLNNFVNSNKKISKSEESNDTILEYLVKYWNLVVDNVVEWRELEEKNITKKDLRENYIVTYGVTILALGQLAEFFFVNKNLNMEKYLKNLKKVNWMRSNDRDWKGCAIKENGCINRNSLGIELTYLRIKQIIGLELNDKEKKKIESCRK